LIFMAKNFPKYQGSTSTKKRTLTNIAPRPDKTKFYVPKPADGKPSISLKFFDAGYKTFSHLGPGGNLKPFDRFVKDVCKAEDWESIFKAYKVTPSLQTKDKIKKKRKILEDSFNLDPEQTEIFHLRLSKKFRIHGFLYENRFKLVWLDPDHEIDDMS